MHVCSMCMYVYVRMCVCVCVCVCACACVPASGSVYDLKSLYCIPICVLIHVSKSGCNRIYCMGSTPNIL